MSSDESPPSLCERVCGALRGQADEIQSEYLRILRSIGPHYASRPDEELAETTSRATEAYLAILCAGDWTPMEAFIREIAGKRFPLRFPLSEVQQAYAVFREIGHPLLIRRFEGEDLSGALAALDQAVDRSINRFSDIYQQLHLEEIRAKSEELAEAHRRLRGQYEEVAEAARIKSQFFANMSHELRSPLNSIIGYAELLLDGIDGPMTQEQEGDLERIRTSSHYLLKLINNILDMTKIEAGRMQVEVRPFAVRALLAQAIDTVAPLAYRKRINLLSRVEEDAAPFTSDPDKVKQILINLLSNAVKFTDAGEVSCTVRCGASRLEVEVRDTGIGIDAGDRERIFGKFFQVEHRGGGEHRGTGLGLPLCRMLVELLGGKLEVESEPKRGSRFWFWIPAGVSAPAGGREPPAEDAPKILVIEDDPSSVELFSRVLEREGMKVVAAKDGVEGLALARAEHPAAITLDLLMPRVDGWEVLQQLKSDPQTAAIPVAVVSCVDRQERARRSGADAYLVKPVDRAALVRTLKSLVAEQGGAAPP